MQDVLLFVATAQPQEQSSTFEIHKQDELINPVKLINPV